MSVEMAVCSSFAPKPAWAKPTGLFVVSATIKPAGIEIWLGENELFENAGRRRLHPATLRRLIARKFRPGAADRNCETGEMCTRQSRARNREAVS